MADYFNELQNPATSSARLHEISLAAPEHAALIAQHPNAYPELVRWAREYAEATAQSPNSQRTVASSKKTIIFASIAAALVLVLGGLGTAWALNAAAPNEQLAEETAAPLPLAEAAVEPEEDVQDIQLDPEHWVPEGNLLVYEGMEFSTADRSIHAYSPDEGELEIRVSDYFAGEEITHIAWTTYGDEAPGIAIAALLRTPAEGITPPGFRVEVVSIGVDGTEVNRQVVSDGLSEEAELVDAVGSYSDTIAVAVHDDGTMEGVYSSRSFGVDVVTGTVRWEQDGTMVAPVYGAVTLSTGFYEDPPYELYCGSYTSLDVESGKVLWRIAAEEEPRVNGRCTDLSVDSYLYWATAMPNEAMHDSIINVSVGDHGLRENRVFDALSGDALMLRTNRVPLFDPVQRLALQLDGVTDASSASESTVFVVYNVDTGEVVYEMDNETVTQLNLDAQQLYDGILYASTADENVAIKMADGEVIAGGWEAYPVGEVAGWLYYSDGLLSRE